MIHDSITFGSDLVKLLELAKGNTNDRKAIVEMLPKELSDKFHGEVVKRELLLTEAVERTGLVQTMIADRVVEGARYATCMRELVWNVQMSTDVMNVPYGSSGIYAGVVAEGAELPSMYQDYNYKQLTAKKYGMKVPISQEMVDDSKFNLAEIELMKAGQAIENTLNRVMIDSMVANAGNEYDANNTASNQGLVAVINGKTKVASAGFQADTLVMHPELAGALYADWKPAYNIMAEETIRSGKMPILMGMKSGVCNITATTATNWDYDTDNDYGGLVFDSLRAAVLGVREPISTKYNEDPFKMLVQPTVWSRFDGTYIQTGAICKLKF